jgi:hypothetical protein
MRSGGVVGRRSDSDRSGANGGRFHHVVGMRSGGGCRARSGMWNGSVIGRRSGSDRSGANEVVVGVGRGNRFLLVGVVPAMDGLVGTTWTAAVLGGAGALEA